MDIWTISGDFFVLIIMLQGILHKHLYAGRNDETMMIPQIIFYLHMQRIAKADMLQV